MPVSDPTSGRTFIWLIACFLFISIIAGGGCLVAYLLLPDAHSPSLLEIGVVLVCLPWAFWILTFLYRVISRACGLRGGIAGGAGNPRNASANVNAGGGGAQAHDGQREAQAVAVNENDDSGELHRTSSIGSHESEMPLAKSMAS